MSFDFPSAIHTFKTQPTTGPQPPYLQYPNAGAGFEDVQAYDPATNMIFAANELTPNFDTYFGLNASLYAPNAASPLYFFAFGFSSTPINTGTCSDCGPSNDNTTIWGINAATGGVVWHHFIPLLGYRGGVSTSGGLVFVTLASGDMQILNAANGNLIRDFFVGGPLTELTSVGAAANGQMMLITPINAGLGSSSPGDVLALTLNVPVGPAASTTTVTSTATTTTTATSTTTAVSTTTTLSTTTTTALSTTTSVSTSSTGVSSTALYGVAAVAVIFIIATGYLAMRGRKPTS